MEISPVILVLLAIVLFLSGMMFGHYRYRRTFSPEIDKICKKYTTFFDNTYSGFALHELIYDISGKAVDARYIEVNRRFMQIYDLKEELVGKTMREAVPFCKAEWFVEYDQVLKSGKSVTRTAYLDTRDTFIEVTLFPLSGKTFGATIHDITPWVKAEQHLKHIISNVNGVFFSISRNGIFTLSEGLALVKLGLKPGEVVGLNAFEVYRDHPGIIESLHKCLQGQFVETVHLINDTWLETRYTPVFDIYNKVIGILGIAVDITEQTHAHELLIQNEAKYRSIVENIHSGFTLNELIFDEKGIPSNVKILHANNRFRELYYLSEKEISEHTYATLFPGFERDFADKANQVVITGKSYTRVGYNLNNRFIESTFYKATDNQFIRLDTDLTDRLLTESELEASRQKFLGIYNLLSDMAGIMKLSNLRLVECNPAFTRLTGYTPREYLGKTLPELQLLVNPADEDNIRAIMTENEVYQGYELTIRTRDGKLLTFLLTVQQIVFENEPSVLFLAHDITERKKAEEALEKRIVTLTQPLDVSASISFEDLFNTGEIQVLQDAFASATGVASLITTPEGIPITKPSNFCGFCKAIRSTEIGGRNCRFSDGVIGKYDPTGPIIQPCLSGGLWDAGANITVGDKHLASWLIGQIRNEKQDVDRMRRYAKEVGLDVGEFLAAFEEVPVMSEEQFKVIARSLYTLAQHLSRLAYQNIQQARFITELKKTQDKLLISEQKFSDIYQMSPGIIGISRISDGRIIDGNLSMSRIGGYSQEEFMGKTTLEMGIWKSEASRSEMLEELRKKGEIINREITLTLKNGIDLICLFSARKITYHDEECLLFLVQDISDRKRIEEQIIEMNANLEKTIAERTKQLQQAIRDQETFAYSVSHDLRSPLRHIEGFLRLMINRLDIQDETVKGYFEKINVATGRMAAMIDDLLSFSRLGRKDLDIKSVDLNILVGEVIDQFKIAYQNREIEWKLNLLPVIECDRNLFKQVFENLISNALKYTSKRRLSVIEIGARDLPENIAEIYVKDNGIGFSMSYAHRLFGVFQRLHNSEEYTGTGIGLANVKQILTRHNGKVRAEGILNEGAVFYLTIHKP
jgi:PAS domain S-box-containing protein